MAITHRQLFLDHLAKTSDAPLALEIEKAEHIYLYDVHGKSYIDLISGIAVSNVGHRHPKVISAIKNQLDAYMHLMVYGEYIQSPQVKLAAALVKSTQSSKLNQVYFTNSGTEAVEGAMKLAKRYTGRTEIISCFQAYHGATQGALSLAGDENFKNSFRPLLPDIRHIRHGNLDDLTQITHKTAAIVIEIVGGESGVRLASKTYFKALKQRCQETGCLLIIDEIQTGFGRTGTFWAFQAMDIEPDILLSAKGMGGGMPIGAFIAPEEIMQTLTIRPVLGHITTFGGHPVSCASSLATLDTIFEECLLDDVEKKSQLFKDLLIHPSIKEVRGIGLMLAVEMDSFQTVKAVIDTCIEQGLITDWFLFCDYSIRIAPPLVITEEEIKIACNILLQAIEQVSSKN
ncbi:aspartate aminotransferase family protein [Aquirufa nivalisilvae]|uniref:aspartate aminotransferase family protein n=1 Tax=Aquirufa nivalisilvae TaxID=2516557 RepID=UPI0022A92375|nr:aspartate aminotransferase family protein [Aquirufa nivalisilvae]MCZ2482458.1 aspartate aminotransferase family protein [Aquirufa nivalisilvae]